MRSPSFFFFIGNHHVTHSRLLPDTFPFVITPVGKKNQQPRKRREEKERKSRSSALFGEFSSLPLALFYVETALSSPLGSPFMSRVG